MSLHDLLGYAIDVFVGLLLGSIVGLALHWPPELIHV